MSQQLAELMGLLDKGGFVAPPLVVGALILWWGMGYRCVSLYAIDRRSARALVHSARRGELIQPRGPVAEAAAQGYAKLRDPVKNVRPFLTEIFHGYSLGLGRYSRLISGIVKIAPLLGLLGTVAGMIETFDALGDASGGAAQGTGVAGGISEALFSTQLGLLVAVPGLLFGRLLDRRQQAVQEELDKLEDILATEGLEAAS